MIDNGPGVADELKDRMFFPLVSGREDGTGLGLTLAQAFVPQHNGSIEFDAARPHGVPHPVPAAASPRHWLREGRAKR